MTYDRIYKLLDHERMRWKTMDYRKLVTRLSRITKEEKLHCFLILATETGNQKLFNAGVIRAGERGVNIDMGKVRRVARETKVIPVTPSGRTMTVRYEEKKSVNDLIQNAPKFVTPDENKYRKPEDKYLNMFTRDELTRCIDF